MALITEEERELFRQTPTKKLAEMLEKHTGKLETRPDTLHGVKAGLRSEYFWTLADRDKTVKEKSEKLGLSKTTVRMYTNALRETGLLAPEPTLPVESPPAEPLPAKPPNKKYAKEDFDNAMKRYADAPELRKAVSAAVPVGSSFTVRNLCEALGVPPVTMESARDYYGADYSLYSKIDTVVEKAIKLRQLECSKRGRVRVLKCLKKIDVSSKASKSSPKESAEERLSKLHAILKKLGPCSPMHLYSSSGLECMVAKRLLEADKDVASVSRPPEASYGFFSKCFGHNKARLLVYTKDDGNMQRMADMLLECLPKEIYPWFERDIGAQLGYMQRNGLPRGIAEKIRDAYKSRLVEVRGFEKGRRAPI